MTATKLIGLRAGAVAAIIGCNGKTSLLYHLAEENRSGRVLLTTTTHIRRPARMQYDRELAAGEAPGPGINLLHGGAVGNKLRGPDPAALCALCEPDVLVLAECDGSRGLPFKGWGRHEPVIPPCTTVTIGVCATWRVGECFSEKTVHRPTRFRDLTGARHGMPVTWAHLAAMVSHPQGMFRGARGGRVLLINRRGGDADESRALAGQLPAAFRRGLDAIIAADLRQGHFERIE